MNIMALYYYIAHELHSFLRVYEKSSGNERIYTLRIDLEDQTIAGIKDRLLALATRDYPVLVRIGGAVLYGVVETAECFYIAGPVACRDPFPLKNEWADGLSDTDLSWLPEYSLEVFTGKLLLIHDILGDVNLPIEPCLTANGADESAEMRSEFTKQVFANREIQRRHNPHDHELREMMSIENGDAFQLKVTWTEQFAGDFGITSLDSDRDQRNLGIITVAFATRAAIRGGVLPEVALSLGDVYMQKIDSTPQIMETLELARRAEMELTLLVADVKRKRDESQTEQENPTVRRCKDYIYKHLQEKLSVKAVADALGIHPNYLSTLFREHTGGALYDYIIQEKLDLAKNLLTFTDYSYSEISSYLGFSSQSHLGKVFKGATGLTLMQYRNKYRE